MSDAAIHYDVIVKSREKPITEVPGVLVCCAVCGDTPTQPTLWIIFKINGHIHAQCSLCDETYCQAGEQCL